MKTLSVSALKAHLSEALRDVQAGEEIVVSDRGRPIARLVPLTSAVDHDAERAKNIAEGIVRPGRGGIDPSFWDLPRGDDPEGSVRKAVLEEREEGW